MTEAQSIMGRSGKAFEYKVIDGGLYHKNLTPVVPFPSKISFIVNLRKKKKLPLEIIPPHLTSGKISKLFKKITRQYEGIHSIPVNKRHLIPAAGKTECRNKYDSTKAWWKFSSDVQANPYMRSQTYKKYEGLCALCGNNLSEGEFQAHHSCYDHACSFDKTIFFTNKEQKKIRLPDCETCHSVAPDKFKQCLSRLHAVHGACNKKLYDVS